MRVNARDERSEGSDGARLNRDGVSNAGHNKRRNREPRKCWLGFNFVIKSVQVEIEDQKLTRNKSFN